MKIVKGKDFNKLLKDTAKQAAQLQKDASLLVEVLPSTRGTLRADIIQTLEEIGWGDRIAQHRPRRSSDSYFARANQLRNAAARWRAFGRPDLARKCLADAERAEKAAACAQQKAS